MKVVELNGLNEKVYIHTTKEGLPIYMWVSEKVKSTFMTLSVNYGSVHTKFKVKNNLYEVPNGTAHFLEHVKFNIKDGVTAHDEFYKIGGDANAFTTFKYTSYVVFATENKKDNLNLLLDFVYNPYFTKTLINKEKGIIVEEANSSVDDAYVESFYKSIEDVLQKSKYRNLITGTPKDVKAITLNDIKLVYNTFYHPKNMFLCITGNFNPYEMVQVVEDNLSKKKFLQYNEAIIINESEPKKVTNKYKEHFLNLTYPRIKYQVKIPLNKFKINNNQELVKFKILLNLILNINFGPTSDFKDELMENELIQNIYFNNDLFDDYFILSITSTTNYKDEVIKRIEEKFKNLDINEKDVKRKKNATISTLILDYEDVEVVNSKLQDELIEYKEIITNYKDILDNITLEDIEKVKDKISLENTSVSVFLPKENQEN